MRTVLTCCSQCACSVVGEGSSTEQKISEEESEGDKIEKVDKAIQEALQNTRERQTGRHYLNFIQLWCIGDAKA